MKASNYNTFFGFEDKIIGYNSLTDKFIILDPFLKELFDASRVENQITEINNIHSDLYNTLNINGFIIPNEIDELEEIKRISFETDFDDSIYRLTINPTMNCNFKCWYCYETHIKDSKLTENTIFNIVEFINKLLTKNNNLKNFNLEWFGGEPMLYFKKAVEPILKIVSAKMEKKEINFSSSFTTNGLLINQNILDDCKKYNVNLFQITLDGNRERHNKVRFISDKKGSYDEILSNIKLSLKNKISVVTRINISEETLDELLDVLNDFKDTTLEDREYLSFSFHKIWQVEENLSADISSIVEEFRKNNFNCFYLGETTAGIKNSCYADKLNAATINYNGDVFKCTARDFKTESREGYLENGDIIWDLEKTKKRLHDTRFKNKPCLSCKILPICNGGCSQHRIEHENSDYCVYNFDENEKLNVIKEKFQSRLQNVKTIKSEEDVLTRLAYSSFLYNEEILLDLIEDSFSLFFKTEIRSHLFNTFENVTELLSIAIQNLRKKEISLYLENINKIDTTIKSLVLTQKEERIFNFYHIPVKAYQMYKEESYDKAVSHTIASILNDDFFLENYPMIYGHKIQQIHNLIRVSFKRGDYKNAHIYNNKILSHLLLGSALNLAYGKWYDNYSIDDDEYKEGIQALVYQIFTETIFTITEISTDHQQEEEMFNEAFSNILVNKKWISGDVFSILIEFLIIKESIYNDDIDQTKLSNWINAALKNKYGYMIKKLFYNIFACIANNNFIINKNEYKGVNI